MKKILKVVAVIIVILVAFSLLTKRDKTPTTNTNEIQPTISQTKIIKVEELADSFDENQVAAEQQWKNVLVQFSAKISNITDTGIGFYDVASKEFSLTQITCHVKDKNTLLQIKNGQTITVKGVVKEQYAGVIVLENCEIVQ